MYGGGISTSLLGSGHRSGLLDSSHRNRLSPSFNDGDSDVSVQVDLSGIWKEEDSTTGNYAAVSAPSYSRSIPLSPSKTFDRTVNTATSHTLQSCDSILFGGLDAASPLSKRRIFYMILSCAMLCKKVCKISNVLGMER